MAIVRKTSRDAPNTPQATSGLNGLEDVRAKAKAQGLYYFPLPIERIIAQYGIRVVYDSEMDDTLSGYIEYAQPNQWTIGVNQYHSTRRQRFTLAHELGHYILHREQIMRQGRLEDSILLRDGDSTDIEVQANHFAGQLLVPTANL
mgnify:FL=1